MDININEILKDIIKDHDVKDLEALIDYSSDLRIWDIDEKDVQVVLDKISQYFYKELNFKININDKDKLSDKIFYLGQELYTRRIMYYNPILTNKMLQDEQDYFLILKNSSAFLIMCIQYVAMAIFWALSNDNHINGLKDYLAAFDSPFVIARMYCEIALSGDVRASNN